MERANEGVHLLGFTPSHQAIIVSEWYEMLESSGLMRRCSPVLAHSHYINSLPSTSSLLTPLHFTTPELDLLKGTNLAGAVEDQRRTWQEESEIVRQVLRLDKLTWWVLHEAMNSDLNGRAGTSIVMTQLISLPDHFPPNFSGHLFQMVG